MKHFSSLVELHKNSGGLPPGHPMISMLNINETHQISSKEFTTDFYAIGFKRRKPGKVLYGRTKNDTGDVSMNFVRPAQRIDFDDLEFEVEEYLLLFHQELINGDARFEKPENNGLFNYKTNQALHLSPREEAIIWDFFKVIENECFGNQDEFSTDIMISRIASILLYAQRFYKRQLIYRKSLPII